MAVKLNGIDLSGASMGTPRKASSSPQGVTSNSQDPVPQQADVNITKTAALLANLEQSLGALPAVDPKRVAAVSRAITSGSYHVQPDRIATGLLQSERALGILNRAEI